MTVSDVPQSADLVARLEAAFDVKRSDAARRPTSHTLRGFDNPQFQARFRVIELLKKGVPPAVIARLLGMKPGMVYYWTSRYRADGERAFYSKPVAGRRPGLSAVRQGRLYALAEQGLSQAEIGRRLGMSRSLVEYWLSYRRTAATRRQLGAILDRLTNLPRIGEPLRRNPSLRMTLEADALAHAAPGATQEKLTTYLRARLGALGSAPEAAAPSPIPATPADQHKAAFLEQAHSHNLVVDVPVTDALAFATFTVPISTERTGELVAAIRWTAELTNAAVVARLVADHEHRGRQSTSIGRADSERLKALFLARRRASLTALRRDQVRIDLEQFAISRVLDNLGWDDPDPCKVLHQIVMRISREVRAA